jgi:hypothetical protein
LLLTNCKTEKKTEQYVSALYLTENLSDFTNQMTKNDTIRIFAELNMEWWIRRDELLITKKNNKIQLQVTIKEDTTFERKFQMRTNKLSTINLKNLNNNFEQHFVNKIKRTEYKPVRQYIYKIMAPNDTLTFYTRDLADKGKEIEDYYKFMSQYYPNEKEFISIEVKKEN